VKGKCFDSWRSVGVAAQAVRVHALRGVDEVMLLDVGATPEGRGPDLALVEELSEVLFVPLAVGGGVRSLDDAKALLRAGADKVVVGSGGVKTIRAIADVCGSQAVVAAVDYRDNGYCYTRCGMREIPMSPALWARELVHAGAGEVLLTNIDREGTMEGYDLEMILEVRDAISVPLVAHGGCRDYSDMEAAIRHGANAVAAGALFQFENATPRGAVEYLHRQGIEVRL
jgi:cyclase